MNKDLQNDVYEVPQNVLTKISETLGVIGSNWVNGRQRAENLIKDKKVNYGQLKRIIHDIQNIDKVNDKTRYDLYGGELMEKWAKPFLDQQRSHLKNKKMASHKVNNNTGINGMRKNPFIKSHEKRDSTKIATNFLKSNSDETSVSPITSLGIFEEIKRIKNIINY